MFDVLYQTMLIESNYKAQSALQVSFILNIWISLHFNSQPRLLLPVVNIKYKLFLKLVISYYPPFYYKNR